jgi:hypothetical protein
VVQPFVGTLGLWSGGHDRDIRGILVLLSRIK